MGHVYPKLEHSLDPILFFYFRAVPVSNALNCTGKRDLSAPYG